MTDETADDPTQSQSVDELVAQCVLALESGGEAAVERICAANPRQRPGDVEILRVRAIALGNLGKLALSDGQAERSNELMSVAVEQIDAAESIEPAGDLTKINFAGILSNYAMFVAEDDLPAARDAYRRAWRIYESIESTEPSLVQARIAARIDLAGTVGRLVVS